MRPTVLLLACCSVLGAGFFASPSLAQGVPANPFASNYPSAPPPLEQAKRARTRQVRPGAHRNGERALVPPGRVPSR